MAETLTDHEINQIRNRAHVGITSDVLALIASHRALATERDAAYKTSAEIVETSVKTQDELGERIRTLESACEAALKSLKSAYDYYMGVSACGDFSCACGDIEHCGICQMRESTRSAVEQLEGAIK